MLEIVSGGCMLGGALVLSATPEPLRVPERAIRLFCYFALLCLATGAIASALGRLGDMIVWTATPAVFLAASIAFYRVANRSWPTDIFRVVGPDVQAWRVEVSELPPVLRIALMVLAGSLAFTLTATSLLAMFTLPHNWDSMTYHLSRIGYFLQQGHLGHFESNYYPQILYPMGTSVLKLYPFLLTGRDETATQFVQFFAYLATLLAIYGSSRILGAKRIPSVIAAMTFALLPNVLLESTTTQDDLLMASFACCSIYFLLRLKQSPTFAVLWMAACATAIMAIIKLSYPAVLPTLALIGIYVWPSIWKALGARVIVALPRAAAIAVVGAAIVFSFGYTENFRRYGDIGGPPGALSGMIMHDDLATRLGETAKNGARYFIDTFSFEGVPDTGPTRLIQKAVRYPLKLMEPFVEQTTAPLGSYSVARDLKIHEDMSSAGMVGIFLLLPALAFALARWRKERIVAIVAGGAVLSFIYLCWQTYYDPWQHRRLMALHMISALTVSMFVAWLIAYVASSARFRMLAIIFLSGVMAYSGVIGVSTVLFRLHNNLLPLSDNVFYRDGQWVANDRIAMFTRNRTETYAPIKKFEELVPSDAVVALAMTGDQFDYPLFGKGLTRKLLPIRPWNINIGVSGMMPAKLLPIPEEAEYLLYWEIYYPHLPGDIDLGGSWWLRRLEPPA